MSGGVGKSTTRVRQRGCQPGGRQPSAGPCRPPCRGRHHGGRQPARGAHPLRLRQRLRRAAGRRPGSVPGEVPQDGRVGLRLLPGHRVPVLRRPGRRAARRRLCDPPHRPGVDPRRPARRELRHLPGVQRPAGLQRQRLRRGLRRPLHLGPQALRRLRGPAGLCQGARRRHDQPPGDGLRGRLPRAHPAAGQGRGGAAADPGHRPGAAARRPAQRPHPHPGGAARLDDGRARPRPALHRGRRRDTAGRGHPRGGAHGLRGVPGDAARGQPGPARQPAGQGRGGAPRDRHRQRGPALVQPAARRHDRRAGERRRHLHEAGADPGGLPAHHRPRGARLLPARGAAHRRLPAGAAGARRPVAGLDGTGGSGAAGRRGVALRGRPGLVGPGRPRADRGGRRGPGPGHRDDACRGRRRERALAGALLHRGRHRRGDRRRRGRLRTDAGGLRPLLRRPGPRRPPDLRGPLPQRAHTGAVTCPSGAPPGAAGEPAAPRTPSVIRS
ncbi:conserved hypothetical protein [Actinacidiphila bryophytorum]|uniref:Uncharacterized protein n=1 Tax=Actinacidiphila bryophytorum TaxID=1436133 RepID=A0A9W4E5G9_9ACTN|nr:conserved hypothetical protein [Actinacidiphila bryophytorum]